MPPIICLLVTNDYRVIGDPFPVRFMYSIYISASVWQVAAEIIGTRSDFPRHLRPLSLTLWKLNTAFPFDPLSSIPDYVKNLNLGSSDGDRNAEEMAPVQLVNHYFSQESLPEGHVHVVVQLPYSAAARCRRKHAGKIIQTESGNLANLKNFLSESMYLYCSPSWLAKPKQCKENQDNERYRILNDRPEKDVKVTPIALLYQPFGRFLDSMRESPLETDGIDIDAYGLEMAVDDFAIEMSRHYPNESSRQTVALDHLNKIFASNKSFQLPEIRDSTVSGKRQSRGHAYGPAHVMETVVGITNEFGSGQGDPEVQITAYFAQMHGDHIDSGCCGALYKRFLFPTLGITIIGRLNIRLTFHVDSRSSPFLFRSIRRIRCSRSP